MLRCSPIVAVVALAACGGDDSAGAPPSDASVPDATALGDARGAGDGGTLDGAASDAPPPPCSGPGASPDAWTTLGHDAARTSASNGCIHASLHELWRYGATVTANDASVPLSVVNAVADSDSLYVHLQWKAPTLDRVAANTGSQTWRYTGSADFDASNWLSVGLGYVLAVDDGVYQIDQTTGKLKTSPGVDWWGDNLVDATRFYLVTTTHGDGPGAFVGAWDVAKGLVWKANLQGSCAMPIGDENNAIALDAGTLFYAPWYRVGTAGGGVMDGTPPFATGIYAFDAAAGTKKWAVAETPQSALAASDGNLYLVETGGALVARCEATGAVVWRAQLADAATSIGSSPPVIAAGNVIIGTAQHVLAFDAGTGKPVWSAAVNGAGEWNPGQSAVNFLSCPANVEPVAFGKSTHLAAATASGTLVVAASDAIHVLSLATGAELGTHALAAASDPVIVGDRVYVVASGATGGNGIVALQSSP